MFRCFDAEWNELWHRSVELDPAGIGFHPSGILKLATHIVKRAGSLCRVDAGTGRLAWQSKLKRPGLIGPTVVGDRVCVVAEGKLVSFKVCDGKPVWSYEVVQESYPPVASLDASILLVGHHGGAITCIDAVDGKPKWTRKLPGENGIVCRHGDAVFGAGWGGALHALGAVNGRVLGKSKVKVWSKIITHDGQLLFQTKHDNEKGYRFGSVNPQDLQLRWELDVPFSVGDATYSPEPVQVVNGELLVKTDAGPVYAIDVKRGKIAWQVPAADLWRLDPSVRVLGTSVVVVKDDVWVQAGRAMYRVARS